MIIKRALTGLTAVVVTVFSLSMLGIMWKLNKVSEEFGRISIVDHYKWSGARYCAELHMKEGLFDKFVLYCSESA